MAKYCFTLLAVYLCSCCATAQRGYRVEGKITDSTSGAIVELVTVQLKSPTATTPEYVQLSDLDGNFIFDKVQVGNYNLEISYVGYLPKVVAISVHQNIKLGAVSLTKSAKTLSEATITATKALIIRNSEKTVFNVAQSPSHQTGTAEDALRNMPGVTIDRNGNISMIGKQGVKVLVDGKPSILAESNLQAFLKSIPANTIESIELITNPSARYDANGNAGIINIKLKKGKRDGLNGTISAGYGFLDRYNGNLVLNYRKNKVNLFATYAINYREVEQKFTDHRDIFLHDSLSHYYLSNPSRDINLSNTLKAGLDFFVDDKNTVTYTFSGSHTWSRTPAHSTAQSLDAQANSINSFISDTYDKGLNYSITNDINYLHKYDTTDRELALDISHTYVNGGNNNTLNSNGYDPVGNPISTLSLIRRMVTANDIHNFIFQLDYAEPLKRTGHKIETGLKNETTLNRNDYNVFDQKANTEARNTLLSNSFNYLENIAAFYIIYHGAYKQWLTYSGGLRTEHTLIKSETNNVSKNYLSFFPSGTVEFALGKQHSLSLSYSRRVQRPEFRQINNSVTYFDQYSTWEGNPNISPSFSNIVSLTYSFQIKKNMFSISSENTFRTGAMSESSHVDSQRITRGTFINGGDDRIIGGSIFAKLTLTKWWDWQMNHYIAWQKFDYKKDVNAGPVSGVYYNLWMSMDFKFWKNTILNFNGWFNTGDVFPQGTSRAVGVMNASIKKDFLHDRLSVNVVVQNIFNTMKFQWEVNNTNLHTLGSWQNYNRAVTINLTYRFGRDANPVKHKETESNSRLSGGSGKGR